MINEIVKARTNITEYLALMDSNSQNRLIMHKGTRDPYRLKLETIKNSIYAVDIEASAVDITKLRLWLSLVVDAETDPTADEYSLFEATRNPKPLPNLDCNIRCGNSLIDEINGVKLIKETALFGDSTYQTAFGQNVYENILAELFVAQDKLFSEKDHNEKELLKNKIAKIKDHLIMENVRGTVAEEEYQSTKSNPSLPYFVWQLEFAKVFKDKGGFDVVIGNPPYVDSETMVKIMPEFRECCYSKFESAKGNWDLYVLFIELGYILSDLKGIVSFIIPNKIVAADYAKSVRNIMIKNSVSEIRDYSNVKVFKEASVYPVTFLSNKVKVNKTISMKMMKGLLDIEWGNKIDILKFNESQKWDVFFTQDTEISAIIEKVLNNDSLDNIATVKGAATVSEAYEIKDILTDKCEYNSEIHFKFINTGTIDPYLSLWSCCKTQYIKDKYYSPIILKNDLKLKYPKRYIEAEKEKIIIGGMCKGLECCHDKGVTLAGKSTTIIYDCNLNIKVLLSILNSKFMTKFYKIYFNSLSLAGGFYRIGAPQIKQLPIPNVDAESQITLENLVDQILTAKQTDPQADTSALEAEIDKIVYELYDLTDEEIKIVEESVK